MQPISDPRYIAHPLRRRLRGSPIEERLVGVIMLQYARPGRTSYHPGGRFMNGTKATLDDLAPAIYDELRRLAGSYLARERSGHTLQPTALVHEAYVRMAQQHSVDWADRNQFLSCAASMMRRVLLNYARARSAEKRQQMLIQTTGRGAAGGRFSGPAPRAGRTRQTGQ